MWPYRPETNCVRIGAQYGGSPFRGRNQECEVEATKVGIREFRSGLAEFIAAETPVAVTRHGQTVGFFIPTPGQANADVAALKKASKELDRLLAARLVDIDAVAAEFKAIRKKNKTGGTGKRLARKAG